MGRKLAGLLRTFNGKNYKSKDKTTVTAREKKMSLDTR